VGGGGVPYGEGEAVFEGEFGAGFEQVLAAVFGRVFIHLGGAKRIGGEEAVIAGVPAGGEAEVAGMIQEGDGVGLCADGAGHGDPFGGFAPDLVALVALAIEDGA